MADKDVSRPSWREPIGAKRFSLVLASLFVLGTCGGVRYFWNAESASAQAPARRNAPVRQQRARTDRSTPAASVAAGAAAANSPKSPPQQSNVVAVVNHEQITRDQLARECLRRHGEEVLESVVNKHLIMQACQQKGIQIADSDIDAEITRMAEKFGLSPDRWLQMLREEREIQPDQYRRDIIWPMLALRRLAAEKLNVSQQELEEALESEYGPKVQVRMISTTDRQKAHALRAEAVASPDGFGVLAKTKSEDVNSAASRGLIPPVRKHVGDRRIEQAVFALKEGEISPVVEAAGQFLIFKCEKHIPASEIPEAQRQRVRDDLAERIRDRKLRSEATQLFANLQQKANVVNVYNDANRRGSMPGVAATINGRPIPLDYLADECFNRYAKEVLEAEINRRILQQALRRRSLNIAREDLDQEIDRMAETYGYVTREGTADREAWLKHVTTEEEVTLDLYVQDAVWPTVALRKLVEGKVEVTPEDLQKGFDANYGERIRVLAIVVGNRHTANNVWKMAKDNPTEQFFGELANRYSIESVSRSNFGEVPPIGRYSGQPLLEEEAFSLGPAGNELSGVLSIGGKFIILRYIGRTEPIVKKLEDVRGELEKEIHQRKLQVAMVEEFDRLRTQSQIDNYLAGTVHSANRAQATPGADALPKRR